MGGGEREIAVLLSFLSSGSIDRAGWEADIDVSDLDLRTPRRTTTSILFPGPLAAMLTTRVEEGNEVGVGVGVFFVRCSLVYALEGWRDMDACNLDNYVSIYANGL